MSSPNSQHRTIFAPQIGERLKAIAAEDLAPWCKLGNAVFQATEVSDDGSRLCVVARVTR